MGRHLELFKNQGLEVDVGKCHAGELDESLLPLVRALSFLLLALAHLDRFCERRGSEENEGKERERVRRVRRVREAKVRRLVLQRGTMGRLALQTRGNGSIHTPK